MIKPEQSQSGDPGENLKDLQSVQREQAVPPTIQRKSVSGIIVDSPRTLDPDDALGIEFQNGDLLVTASIVDLAALVPEGSPEDLFARERGTSKYRRERITQWMFPKALALEHLVLKAGETRPAVSLRFRFDAQGDLYDAPEFFRSMLRVEQALSYRSAGQAIERRRNKFHRKLNALFHAARTLYRQRVQQGAPEQYDFNRGLMRSDSGRVWRVSPMELKARFVIQEFMIACNVAAGITLKASGSPALFRNYDGVDTAHYSVQNDGHLHTGAPAYAQWTAPLRRYRDLINLRSLVHCISGDELPHSAEDVYRMNEALNRIIVDARQPLSDEQRAAEARRFIERNGPDAATRAQASRYLSSALEKEEPEPALRYFLERWFRLEKLPAKTATEILLRGLEDERWKEHSDQVLESLALHPRYCMVAFRHFVDEDVLSVVSDTVQEQADLRTVTITVDYLGERYSATSQPFRSEKLARSFAEQQLLLRILNREDLLEQPRFKTSAHLPAQPAEFRRIADGQRGHFPEARWWLAQHTPWSHPDYEKVLHRILTEADLPPARYAGEAIQTDRTLFVMRCLFSVADTPVFVPPSVGVTGSQARQYAAAAALRELLGFARNRPDAFRTIDNLGPEDGIVTDCVRYLQRKSAGKVLPKTKALNVTSILKDSAQAAGLPIPQFHQEKKGGNNQFVVKVFVKSPDAEKPRAFQFTSRKLHRAIHGASLKALKGLLRSGQLPRASLAAGIRASLSEPQRGFSDEILLERYRDAF